MHEFTTIVTNLSGKVRTERLLDVEYIVTPVRMLKEGVLNGSLGPIFYPQKLIDSKPEIWNQMPIVINHPKKDGQYVSARQPSVLEASSVGFVFNTEGKDGNLDAEAWFAVNRLKSISIETYDKIRLGEKVEVSTGLDLDRLAVNGEYNGVEYHSTASNFRPDHLAILLDEKGACSIPDCGLNVNKRSKEEVNSNLALQLLQKVAMRLGVVGNSSPKESKQEETVDMSKLTEKQRKELVDNIIGNCSCGDKDGAQVFTEESREVLNSFEDEQLNKLHSHFELAANHRKVAEASQKGFDLAFEEDGVKYTVNEEGKLVKTVEKTPDKAGEGNVVNKDIKPTIKEYLDNAPSELKQLIVPALNYQNKRRTEIVEKILANSRNKWGKEKLESMDMEDLEAVLGLIDDGQDSYSPQSYLGAPGLAANMGPAEREDLLESPELEYTLDANGKTVVNVLSK